MNETEINIAIAGACGTHTVSPHHEGWLLTDKWGYSGLIRTNGYYMVNDKFLFPLEYTTDLNAMHKAFIRLGRHWAIEQAEDGYICKVEFGPKNRDVIVGGLELLPVMAEAFLKTLGKWKEDDANT